MIATLAEIKSILGYTDTTQDARISRLLPMVENEIVTYCNNTFRHTSIYFSGEITCTVSAGPAYSLICPDGGMDEAELMAGDTIYISGSNRNDGYYTISAITSTQISLMEPIASQAAADIILYLVDIPAGLKIYIAKMIAYQINHAGDEGITGESIGNYSYSRKDGGTADAGYPAELLRGLDKWKHMTLKCGAVRQQYRDYRGYGSSLAGDIDDR
jgi:hypothetical protein